MKPITSTALLATAVILLTLAAIPSARADENKENVPVSSIRPTVEIAKADLPGWAKINFTQAMTIALTTEPGNIIKAELEVEDGNLMYSFEIVTFAKVIMEVELDAGNGLVLNVDND